MTLNDYQKAAERTSGDLTSWDKVRNGCYGLNGEAGECIDILKKAEFQGHDFDPMKMVDELGDVLWYAAQLATGLGVTLEYVAQHNVDKLLARYGSSSLSPFSVGKYPRLRLKNLLPLSRW